ncbi:hypothetical protein DFJ74DRAFT_614316 [Hyaloraphidium curvatum]|nr:hypothetical protein DFJ74DRAFT_614316 [Hyaloraphidium curvatum]
MSSKPRIVVVGGGYAGSQVVAQLRKALSGKASLTLVDARRVAYHMIAAPRAFVDGEKVKAQDLWIPMDGLLKDFPDGKFVVGTVKQVKQKELVLEDGTAVPFDYAVLAMGSINSAPLKFAPSTSSKDAADLQRRVAKAIAAAKDVLIVGGGPNGVETAFELFEKYGKAKNITLVSSGSKLFDRSLNIDDRIREIGVERLKDAGVKVVLGEKVQLPADLANDGSFERRTLKTDKGTEIASDVQLILTGNTKLLSDPARSLSDSVVTAKGDIDTLPTLQVRGFPHIFAIGDVSSQSKTKTVAPILDQLGTLVSNLKSLIDGKGQLKEVGEDKGGMMLITQGTTGGFGQIPKMGLLYGTVGQFMIRNVKGKDLFLSRQWKSYTGRAIH